MTQQQMTDEQIQAAGNRIGTAQARAQRPLKEAGWLLRLPEADVISHTTELVRGLSSEWRLRIEDLNTKMLAWLEASRPKMPLLRTSASCASVRLKWSRQAETIVHASVNCWDRMAATSRRR